MQYTEKFHLAKPDGTDKVDVSVLNSNMEIIDNNLGSSGGGQSDWSVNDSSSGAYIKNRPFYSEELSIDVDSKTVEYTTEEEIILIDDYAPDLSELVGQTVSIGIIPVSGETTTISGTVADLSQDVGVPAFGILIGEDDGYFISGVAGLGVASDTNSILVYISETTPYPTGTKFVFNFPFHYVGERVVRLDNKYLNLYNYTGSVGTDYIKVSSESVVGSTVQGESLYSRTFTIDVSSNLSNTQPLNIEELGVSGITSPYIQDARLDIYTALKGTSDKFDWNVSVNPFYSPTALYDSSDTAPRYFQLSTVKQFGTIGLHWNISDNISYVDQATYDLQYILTVTIFYTKSEE